MKSFFIAVALLTFAALTAGLPVNGNFKTGELAPWQCPQQAAGKVRLFRVIRENGAPSGDYVLESRGDENNRFNGFVALTQTLPVKPSPKAVCTFGGAARAAVKSPAGKHAVFAIREVNAQGTTVKYQEIPLDLADAARRRYEKSFTPDKRTRTLQFYLRQSGLSSADRIYWDGVFFSGEEARPPFDPRKTKAAGPTLELKDGFATARIDAATGLLDTLRFGDVEVQPAAVDNSVIFVSLDGRETGFRKRGAAAEKPGVITVDLIPADAAVPFTGQVEYRLADGFFTEKVTLTAREAVGGPLTLGVRHGFDPANWDKIVCALYPVRAIGVRENTIFSYGEKENDRNVTQLDNYQHPVYPLTLLEGPKGILMVGSFDLDKFVTFAPNMPQGYFPSVRKNPLSARPGEKFEFVSVYRFFPGEKYLIRDVWREYAKRIFSRNPMVAKYFPYRDRPYRTYFPGAHVGSTFFMPSREKQIEPASNIWWFGWLDWETETYPVQGEWWNPLDHGKWTKMSAERMKSEIDRLQRAGHKLALYCRQVANLRTKGTKLPAEWFRAKAGGSLDLYGGGYNLPISPEMQRDLGYPEPYLPWGTFDFDNPSFQYFYLNQVKTAVEFYDTRAVGWDMGWRPDHKGMFAAQASIYEWLRRKHPDKKVVSNECGGGPELFYTDMALLENGALGYKNEYDFEVMKAFGNAMVCIERLQHSEGAVRLNLADSTQSWLSAAGLRWNKRYLDFVLKKHPEMRSDIKALGRLCHLRMCLWDQALGAAPGYLDWIPDVPAPMLKMARETVAIPLITESFVVRFSNRKDRMAPLFASFWLNEKQARLAVFNDSDAARKFTLFLKKAYFAARKWDMAQLAAGQVFILTPETSGAGSLKWSGDGETIVVSGELPPFGAAMLFSDRSEAGK